MSDPDHNGLGAWLEARRPETLSYAEIAREVGEDRTLVWRWFQADRSRARLPSPGQLARLCDVLGVPVAERGTALISFDAA